MKEWMDQCEDGFEKVLCVLGFIGCGLMFAFLACGWMLL